MSRSFSIALGSDHAGYTYKELIKAMLLAEGHTVRDFGTYSEASCDYPDFSRPVAEAVARGAFERGIVLGGSGNGEASVANRVRGVRCGLCWNEQLAIWNRSHNDGNVLSIGQRTISDVEALAIVRTGDDQPSPAAYREATREVIKNCIYGVDLNPLAVELCKVALWLEAHVPGEPLGFFCTASFVRSIDLVYVSTYRSCFAL